MIDTLNILSTLIVGLYAGSLLTEAMILVPYWRRMDSPEFFELHASLGPTLFRYYAPLTASAVALSVIVVALNGGDTLAWTITAGLCLSALAIFFIYFSKANKSFADHSLKHDELPGELTRWAKWHSLRTLLVIIAFATSIAGHSLG